MENIEGGIEHSFVMAKGPEEPFSLRLGVNTEGISSVADYDSNLCFWDSNGPVFVYLYLHQQHLIILLHYSRYQNLVVKDATGNHIKSNMCWENNGIVLNVLETPVFPILIGISSFFSFLLLGLLTLVFRSSCYKPR